MKIIPFMFLLLCPVRMAALNDTDLNTFKGRTAVLFNVNNLSLSAFDGGIGLKYLTSQQFAVIGKVNFLFSEDKEDNTTTINGNENKRLLYGLSLGIEKHFMIQKNLSPYGAFSIGIDRENTTKKILSPSQFQHYIENEMKSSAYTYSLSASFGIEYFITEDISLSGQYNLGLNYSKGENVYTTYYNENKSGVSELKAGISSVGIILAVYF